MGNRQFIEFIVGLAVLFMGLFPFLGKIQQLEVVTKFIGGPGGILYQIIVSILGAVVILQSFKKI